MFCGVCRKIFVGGLARETTSAEFFKHFEKYGEIIDIVIMKDRKTGQPRGFGFVTYDGSSEVDKVIKGNHVINGNFGLVCGKSGSGKTTLLHLLARLNKLTSGSICTQRYGYDDQAKEAPELLPTEKVGIVFQFPERFFVADNVLDEIMFGWPRKKGSFQLKEQLTSNLQRAFNWVGLENIHLDKDPQLLSGGYKRRWN